MVSKSDIFELRDYAPHIVAETIAEGSLEDAGSKAIKWNFTKFLVDRYGTVLRRYASTTTPESLENDIDAALRQPGT